MRISEWSSDVCSSDLSEATWPGAAGAVDAGRSAGGSNVASLRKAAASCSIFISAFLVRHGQPSQLSCQRAIEENQRFCGDPGSLVGRREHSDAKDSRSEEHTSELQSLMRISYAVFCLKKKKDNTSP